MRCRFRRRRKVGWVEAEGGGKGEAGFVRGGAVRFKALDGADAESGERGEVLLRPGALFAQLLEAGGVDLHRGVHEGLPGRKASG